MRSYQFKPAVVGLSSAVLSIIVMPIALGQKVEDEHQPISKWIFNTYRAGEGQITDIAEGLAARIIGEPEPVEDPLGESLIFNGYDQMLMIARDHVTCADSLPKREMTVSAWVLIHTPTRWGGVIGVIQDNGEAEKGWILGYDEDSFYFGLSAEGTDDGDGLLTYLDGTDPLEPGRWFHVAATYDGSTMRLFVNGRLDASSDAQSGDINYPSHAPYVMGAYLDDNERYSMHGRLREISVYDLALTESYVVSLFDRHVDLAALPPMEDTRLWSLVDPYLQYVTGSAISVLWETSRPTVAAVRYGVSLPMTESIVVEQPETIHEVRIDDLEPQTQCFYQVVSTDAQGQEIESEALTFQTAVNVGTPFAFTVIGDTQTNADVVRTIAELSYAQRPNFTLIAGDLVSTGTTKTDWTGHFFPNMIPLISRVPFFPALGNHDQDAEWYYRYIAAPEPEYYYEFRYGDAHCFMIDANRPLDPESEQYARLERDLAASDAQWKFVVHHQPAYTSDENDYGDTHKGASTFGDMNVRQLVALYEKYGVDVVFNGHIHVYERTWPIRDGGVVEDGGVIHITTGGGGGGLEDFSPTRTWFSNTVARRHHFCYVTINGPVLQFKAIDTDDRVFDSFMLHK